MLWEEEQIPNLIVSSSIPCLTLSDLDYSEPLSTTQQRENAIGFFNGYWSRTQEVIEDLGLQQTIHSPKRACLNLTSTLSMIVPSTGASAGASSRPESDLFNRLNTVYRQNNSQSTTSVSSSTCVKKGNTCAASFLETDPRVHRCGLSGSMCACHAADPGSIPSRVRFPR